MYINQSSASYLQASQTLSLTNIQLCLPALFSKLGKHACILVDWVSESLSCIRPFITHLN